MRGSPDDHLGEVQGVQQERIGDLDATPLAGGEAAFIRCG
jgi:hypothetical protein